MEPRPVDIASLVDQCWKIVPTNVATHTVQTTQLIQADETRLQQLLENLFRNAVEHGVDSVAVTVDDLDDGFYIEDDGPGIPEADRETVFEVGYSTNTEGTGLGLSIVTESSRLTAGTFGSPRVLTVGHSSRLLALSGSSKSVRVLLGED